MTRTSPIILLLAVLATTTNVNAQGGLRRLIDPEEQDSEDMGMNMTDTEAPTEMENMKIDFNETYAPSDAATTVEEDMDEPEDEGTCGDNPATYTVNVDIQEAFMDGVVDSCSEADETRIMDLISATLDAKFPSVVDNWDGDALFGAFNFDAEESVDALGASEDFARELRRLRGTAMANARRLALQAKKSTNSRRSLSATCAARNALPCPNGFCRWGCLEVATTDCAGNSPFEKWPLLGQELVNAINTMTDRPDCLGTIDGLNVLVMMEGGPEEEETGAPTEAPVSDSPGNSDGAGNSDNAGEGKPDDVGDGKPEDTPGKGPDKDQNRNGDIEMTDGPNIFKIATTVTVKYFDGQGGEMEDETLDTFNTRLSQLEAGILMIDDGFGNSFARYEITHQAQEWDEETNTLTFKFTSSVELAEGAPRGITEHVIARVLAKPDFKEHIHTLMGYDLGGINELTFTATGKGE